MKKFVCVILCLMFVPAFGACKNKGQSAPKVWIIEPSSLAAETELRQMVRDYDADALISFVAANEIDMRVKAATERGEAPDVFMIFADSIPDMAEKKQLAELNNRLQISKIKTDGMLESAVRSCLYQDKMCGVPLFSDVYMLATNRALVATPPDSAAQLLKEADKLKEKQIAAFEKLTPQKQSVLFESLLGEKGGSMLNTRNTKLTFADDAGSNALKDCATLINPVSSEADAMFGGKAAFSILTMRERLGYSKKYPDTEIALSPLFGLNRMQTVAVCMSEQSKNQKRAFGMVEFLQTNTDKLASLYKCYPSNKNIVPISPEDNDAVQNLSEAKPAPDLCGYDSLVKTYIPAAISKAAKGVNTADALTEAAAEAESNIWKGKRE